MKQAILYGAGDLRLEERPLDPNALEADQVYVETEVTALSTGTDLGNYLGKSSEVPGAPDYPRAVGYSNVGVVKRAGSAVRAPRVGERVFSMKPHQSAYIARQEELMVPVPQGVSAEEASLAYLTQLGVAAMRQARYQAGENLAVVGLGVIGLCTVAIARAMGAKVAAITNSPLRLEVARKLHPHAVYLSDELHSVEDLRAAFGSAGADLVILTANTWEAYRLSVEIVRHGGRISVLGFPGRGQPRPEFNPLDPQWFYRKQLTLIGAGFSPRAECEPHEIRFNLRRNLEFILDCLARGAVALEPAISHRLPAHRMKEAYELAREHSKALTAAVFDWRGVAGEA